MKHAIEYHWVIRVEEKWDLKFEMNVSIYTLRLHLIH